ncbi:MAG: hypothetical protein AB7S26_12740 [Sandaracinaceae bacterium]
MKRTAILPFVLLAFGCQDATLEWRFVLDGVGSVETIGAFVRSGSCGSAMDASAYFFPRRGESPVAPPPLDAGTYCLDVVAYDRECVEVGRGTRTIELPTDESSIVIDVEPRIETVPDALCIAYLSSRDGGI